MRLHIILRLVVDCGIVTDLLETPRCQLTTGVTIDTRGIHVEVTLSVGIESFGLVCHQITFVSAFPDQQLARDTRMQWSDMVSIALRIVT